MRLNAYGKAPLKNADKTLSPWGSTASHRIFQGLRNAVTSDFPLSSFNMMASQMIVPK